jgi:hypothetical protein
LAVEKWRSAHPDWRENPVYYKVDTSKQVRKRGTTIINTEHRILHKPFLEPRTPENMKKWREKNGLEQKERK